MADVETCANPGCTEPGTKQCSACKTTPYCGPICQTADWAHHKEECPGHLRKMGMAHLAKARAFGRERNCPQLLRYAELALTKLKQLKDRSLAFIKILDDALLFKFNALSWMGRDKEALECATERYNMWATTFMRNPRMIEASFPLIDSLSSNGEIDKAHLIASTVYEMTMHPASHDIPEDKQQPYLAQAAYNLAGAILHLAQSGGIPPEEKQKAGEEVIALARKAIKINTELHGAESKQVATNMCVLAAALDYFNDDANEAIRLYQQGIDVFSRLQGSSSFNVAANKMNVGRIYYQRVLRVRESMRDRAEGDVAQMFCDLDHALAHYREAIPMFRTLRLMDKADEAEQTLNIIAAIHSNVAEARTGFYHLSQSPVFFRGGGTA